MRDNEIKRKMENYEKLIRNILKAFSKVEFHIVVESTIGKKIIPVDMENEEDKLLLEDIRTIVDSFAKEYYENPISSELYKSMVGSEKSRSFRNNEVGLFAEKMLPSFFEENKDKLKVIKSFERLPLVGYPDIEITHKSGRFTYLEVKATSRRDVGSPRDFFFSPLKNTKKKIKQDAHHLLICFDTYEQKEKEFIITGWCLIDLFNVKVSMKPEFNADNLELYKRENVLIEVRFDKEK